MVKAQMGLWLTKDELVELTGYKTNRKQKLALAQMSLKFISRPSDGFPLVYRWQFEGEIIRPQARTRRTEPNFAAIRGSPGKKS